MIFTQLGRVPSRQLLVRILHCVSTITSMMMLYAGLGIITNTESPIVVVLSGSMEPAFQRGDILFLTNPIERVYKNGDIVVYNVPGRPIPIVHRVLEIHEMHTFESPATQPSKLNIVRQPNNPSHERLQLMLTKGDNNLVDDIELYNGLEWINHEHVVGRVRGFLPYAGYISIAINDTPKSKYVFFAVLVIFSLLQGE